MAIKTADSIYLATDSKWISYDNRTGKVVSASGTSKKMIYVPETNLVFVFAGKIIRRGAFDMFGYGHLLSGVTNFTDGKARLKESIPRDLSPVLKEIHEQNPTVFKEQMLGQIVTSCILAGFESGIPKVRRYTFVLTEEDGNIKVIQFPLFDDLDEPCSVWTPLFIGTYEVAQQLYSMSRSSDDVQNIPSLMRICIEEQIKYTPETVGPPIEVVKLDATGAHVQ